MGGWGELYKVYILFLIAPYDINPMSTWKSMSLVTVSCGGHSTGQGCVPKALAGHMITRLELETCPQPSSHITPTLAVCHHCIMHNWQSTVAKDCFIASHVALSRSIEATRTSLLLITTKWRVCSNVRHPGIVVDTLGLSLRSWTCMYKLITSIFLSWMHAILTTDACIHRSFYLLTWWGIMEPTRQ